MKRLGFFAICTILMTLLFSMNYAYAAYESAQAYVLNQYSSTSATFQNAYNNQQKVEYAYNITALKGILMDHAQREPADIGNGAFIARSLPDFRTFLAGRLSVATNPEQIKVLNDLDSLTAAVETSSSADNTDQALLNGLSGGSAAQNSTQNSQQADAQLQQTKKDGAEPASACKIVPPGVNIMACIDEGIAWIIKNTLLQLAGFLVWLTANMLNYAIQISVLNFAQWAPSTLYPIWIIIRQIVSLVVVFAGLYLGFMYIIGREDTFGKYVGWLMIFALFVNFSYPVTRALVDVSNIVSLNIYQSAVGSGPLSTNFASAATTLGGDTAGAIIMTKLGLQGLIGSATSIATTQASMVSQIKSTPGALVAVAFVLYAAYIFFMATAIIAVRTAVLVFLIVASPLLLVDSIIPKLGDAAMKMRKLFFEQLIVTPVFMIMLALTLKFMEIFQADGGALSGSSASALSGSGDIKTFFNILMMLIMLHIMIKVTKEVGGKVGEMATNMMGKVGGFGLGVATGGAGLLARGTIGAGAARLRDSGWMDKMQGSSVGRGLYGLSNSLAQTTYDARNIGMVSKGMASAGMGMGAGLKQGFTERNKARQDAFVKKAENIRDDTTRASYFKQKGLIDTPLGRETERGIQEKRASQLAALSGADKQKRQSLIDQAELSKDTVLANKLKAGDEYLDIKNTSPDAIKNKVGALHKMQDDKAAIDFIKGDPFKDLQKEHDETIAKMELKLGTLDKEEREEYKKIIGKAKKEHAERVEELRQALLDAYLGKTSSSGSASPDADAGVSPRGPRGPSGSDGPPPASSPSGSQPQPPKAPDTSRYNPAEYEKSAYQRNPGTSAGAQAIHGSLPSSATRYREELGGGANANEQSKANQGHAVERAVASVKATPPSTATNSSEARRDSKEDEKPTFIRNPGSSQDAQTIHGQDAKKMEDKEIEEIKKKFSEDFVGKMKNTRGNTEASATP